MQLPSVRTYPLTSSHEPFTNEGGGRRRGWGRYAQGKVRAVTTAKKRPDRRHNNGQNPVQSPTSLSIFSAELAKPNSAIATLRCLCTRLHSVTREIASRRHHLCACVCPWPISEAVKSKLPAAGCAPINATFLLPPSLHQLFSSSTTRARHVHVRESAYLRFCFRASRFCAASLPSFGIALLLRAPRTLAPISLWPTPSPRYRLGRNHSLLLSDHGAPI